MKKLYQSYDEYQARVKSAAAPVPEKAPDNPDSKAISIDGFFELWRDPVAAAIYALFLVMVTVAFVTHEPWRDEYQSWGQAEHMSSLASFFVITGEGHPPLFYWMLRLAQGVFSFEQARYLALLIGYLNGLLIAVGLRRQPVLMAVVLFSYPFVFFWSVFLRSYGLGVFFILMAVHFFQSKRLVPCAVMLWLACFTHFYFFFIVPIFVIEEFRAKKSIRLALMLFFPCLFALYIIYLAGQGHPDDRLHLERLSKFLYTFNVGFLFEAFYGSTLLKGGIIVSMIFFMFTARWFGLFILANIVLFALFRTLVYGGGIYHAPFAMLILLTAYLVHDRPMNKILLIAILIPSFFGGIKFINMEINGKYSNGVEIYPAIKAAHLDHLKIFALNDEIFTPSAMKYNLKYISLPMGKEIDGTIVWADHIHSIDRYHLAYKKAGSPKEFVLVTASEIMDQDLSNAEICKKMAWHCTLVKNIDDAQFDNAKIYKVETR